LDCEVSIARGFRHQIRAHFAWLGLPLIGDRLYGGRESPLLRLVASRIEFKHPATGEAIQTELGEGPS
jgi:23S rRNA pseudouridine1911/1915/1917 synthase